MRTLGVDLASQAARTAACVVRWRDGAGFVEEVRLGVDDDQLVDLAHSADVIGIDCPFGWPDPFAALISQTTTPAATWSNRVRDTLRFRETDLVVRRRIGRWPLSVSSDLIAVPALRCQGLLHRLGVSDRSGDGRVWEVYPAASLALWGFANRGYKGARAAARLDAVVTELFGRAPWLRVGPEHRRELHVNHDAFDALIASLTARAAAVHLTEPPPPERRTVAAREGWIALPTRGGLELLID